MKNAIVTGAYGAIGKEIVSGLIEKNFKVFLVGRDRKKLDLLKKTFDSGNLPASLEICCVDLASKDDVYTLAGSIEDTIDVLVNNAATAPIKRMENDQGIEMQWATNVLSYYWMIRAFEPHLLRAEQPRIVNVASYWAGGLNLDDPEFKSRRYNNDTAYRQSKQADRMLSYGLAACYRGKISINACHPGDANSKLSNDLGFGGSESARHAASTPLLLATTPLGIEHTSEYFEYGKKSICRFKEQKSVIERLLVKCQEY